MNPVLWLARGCPSTPITNEKARSLTSSRVMWRSGQLKSSGAVWFYTNWILIGGLTLSANFYQPINVYRVEIENQITRLFFSLSDKGLFQWNNETIQTLLYSVLLMRNKNSLPIAYQLCLKSSNLSFHAQAAMRHGRLLRMLHFTFAVSTF